MTTATVTTDDILDEAEARTGLTRAQLLVLVAKSATVRHLATNPKYKNLFVLKGGTLLSNVYRSPRQSIADADYTYLRLGCPSPRSMVPTWFTGRCRPAESPVHLVERDRRQSS